MIWNYKIYKIFESKLQKSDEDKLVEIPQKLNNLKTNFKIKVLVTLIRGKIKLVSKHLFEIRDHKNLTTFHS